MTNVSIKDTKQVIFEAYQEAIKELKAARTSKFDPVAEKANKEMKTTMKKADEIVGMNILNQEIVDKYNALNNAITLKEAELKEYYGIEKEIDSILALVEAKKVLTVELDKKYEDKRAEFNAELASLLESHKTKKADLDKERIREAEEYKYNLKRIRQIENDTWNDEKAKREAELKAKELIVEEKEKSIEESLDKITKLESEVELIPTLLADAKQQAAETAKAECEKRYAIEKNVIKRETALEKTLLEKELEAARVTIARLEEDNKSLSIKLETAQERVETIATNAVKAAQPRLVSTDK